MSYWVLKAQIYNYDYIDFIDCCNKLYEYFQMDSSEIF